MLIKKNQEITVPIHRLGVNGEGVGDHDGFTLFVDGALPGETVLATVTEIKKTFGRAKLQEVIKRSSNRVKPICPLFSRCGGCQIMHLAYHKQLTAKRQRIVDALARIGKLNVNVESCHPSPMPLGYRNKIQLPVQKGKMGLYAKASHNVVAVKKCYIHNELGERIFSWLQTLPEIQTFQQVNIRTAINSGEVLLAFVSKKTFIPENIPPEVKGIVHSTSKNLLKQKTLWGRNYIEETIHNLQFRISAVSFFQVNPFQAEHLYNQVVEFANLTGTETVLDSYCGVGTLALILAANAKKVIGVESIPEAITDAKANAKRNKIDNAKFVCAKAEEFLPSLTHIDVAIINPPRSGCDPKFLKTLVKLRPKTLIYVSCDPATMARDAKYLTGHSYTLDKAKPFDMFPQTAHVECVMKFTNIS
jgi:23S rRNA (uracil1939-C5)-methyltransferase